MAVQTTAAPGGTLSYVGNPDFRGYLAAVASTASPSEAAVINNALGMNGGTGFVNNSGEINTGALSAYVNNAPSVTLGGQTYSTGDTGSGPAIANYLSGLYGTYNGLTSGNGSSTNTNAAPDAAISAQAGTALDTALQALNASNASVGATEQQQENELDSNEAAQNNTFNNTLTTDNQGLTTAETGARTQGNTDLTSLDRLLGSMGAGGSSVETEEVPALVGRSVASNISGADTTKATNDQAATVAWNTFLNQLASQQQQLTDQANQQIATNQGAYNKSQQALSQIEAAANSGSIDPSDLSYELESAVGQIPAVVNWTPSFSGTTPVYQTPSLSNFTLSPTQISSASGVALPTTGAATIPFLAALTGNQQKQTAATS